MLLLGVIIEYAANSLDRPFSYAYNGDLEVKVGVRVLVPFNNRKMTAYIIAIHQELPKDLPFSADKIKISATRW